MKLNAMSEFTNRIADYETMVKPRNLNGFPTVSLKIY